MKHLVIRNLGPLKEADVELKRINVIIGSQSSGKSCVLKTACYCTWVEKRIELTGAAARVDAEKEGRHHHDSSSGPSTWPQRGVSRRCSTSGTLVPTRCWGHAR